MKWMRLEWSAACLRGLIEVPYNELAFRGGDVEARTESQALLKGSGK